MTSRSRQGVTANRPRCYPRGYSVKILLAAILLLSAVASAVSLAATPSPYAYSISLVHDLPQLMAGQSIVVPVRLENTSGRTWVFSPEKPVHLSYHIVNTEGDWVVHDGLRTPVPQGFRSGILRPRVKIPEKTGHYFLEFDLVHEHVTWFAQKGASPLRIPLHIGDSDSFLKDRDAIQGEKGTAWWCDIPEINRIQPLIKATLESDAVRFIGFSGPVSGFTAGSSYPQLWIRDLATIIPMARYYFDRPYLGSWIDEHLYFQGKEGGVYDWIDSRGLCDKNSVESDQESSLMLAASVYYRMTQDQVWLQERIAGLELALTHLLRERKSLQTGLIWSGYTADWGDVSPQYADHRAVYYDSNTPRVVGLYTNALFCRAAKELAFLFGALGNKEKYLHWLKIAELWKNRINALFWSKPFYRMHALLESSAGQRERLHISQTIFPMGGNAEAILAGIPDLAQVKSIYSEAKRRQRAYGISTIAGSLLPPFPEGFFKHPAMKRPFSYQNGGQWDWFAGRLVLGLFHYGLVNEAVSELIAISEKVIRNRGFFEWDTPDGLGMGSRHYAGGAAVIGEAIMAGLFGVQSGMGAWALDIRLGDHEGKIRVFQPSTKASLYYHYRPSPNRIDVLLVIGTPKQILDIRIWRPPGPWKGLFINHKEIQYAKERENGQWYYTVLDLDGKGFS